MRTASWSRRSFLTGFGAVPILGGVHAAFATPAQSRGNADIWQSIELVGADGQSATIREMRAPLVLVHLWGSWCAPCLRELPSLAGLARRFDPARLAVLLVSHPKHWEADRAYLQRAGISLPAYTLAPETSWDMRAAAFDITDGSYAVPRSLVLAGRDRRCVLSKQGPEAWDSSRVSAQLRRWMTES